MDLGLSADPYESFRLFQERIYQEYLAMRDEFGFVTIDGTGPIEDQQEQVREIVAGRVDLPRFRWRTQV
jgi:dTMP kinase